MFFGHAFGKDASQPTLVCVYTVLAYPYHWAILPNLKHATAAIVPLCFVFT